jgi:plasmid stability protein
MPSLYVRNVPQDLYEALRERARANHRSIAAEVLALLEENIPTAKELRARQRMFRRLVSMRTKGANSERAFPSAEKMQREDRER